MEYKNIFEIKVNWKTITMLIVLAILPNFLGMINLPTVFGFKIHTFQYVIFVAAMLYGPVGGAVSGGIGSMFSAFAMGNPYILGGNILLGLMAGLLFRYGFNIIWSAIIAFAVQLPWLYLTDVYLVGMPVSIVYNLIIALFVSNLVWATAAKYTVRR